MQGGFQINSEGRRFCDECAAIRNRPPTCCASQAGSRGIVFDARIAAVADQFEDYREAARAGAIISADTSADLARAMHVAAAALAAECDEVEALKARAAQDRYGRRFVPEQRLVSAFPRRQSDGSAISHARRAGDRRYRPGEAQCRRPVSQFVCGRRGGRRRVGFDRRRISVRQRAFDRYGSAARQGRPRPAAD